MGWVRLELARPRPARALRLGTGRPGRASDGPFSLYLSMPPARFAELFPGEPDFVEALMGDGEDAGKLMLLPAEKGVRVTPLKHAFVIRLPVTPGVVQEKRALDEPEHEAVRHGGRVGLLVHLPDWAWRAGQADGAAEVGVQGGTGARETGRGEAALEAMGARVVRRETPAPVARSVARPAAKPVAGPTPAARSVAPGPVAASPVATLPIRTAPPDAVPTAPEWDSAPRGAQKVWQAICDAADAGLGRVARMTVYEIQRRTGIRTGPGVVNAVAWLSSSGLIARELPAGKGPPIYRPLARPEKGQAQEPAQ